MLTITSPRRALLRTNLAADAADTLLCACRRTLAGVVERWLLERERRGAERALRQLSPYLLRDLGLHASDIPFIAHAAGAGDDSRVRLTHGARPDLTRFF
jgi:uncharacterized protein YjiS (DUF1127 family)